MNFENLMKNLSDVIVEEQLKLGYRRETVWLYYPPASLQRLLGVEGERAHLEEALHGFCAEARGTLGEVTAVMDAQGGRYCLAVPPQGVQYIHENMGEAPFIAELIRLIERADCTLDDVLSLFQSRSQRVHVERTAGREFDVLVYFEDGVPDSFRYCFTQEGGHVRYHRFTPEDYEELMG